MKKEFYAGLIISICLFGFPSTVGNGGVPHTAYAMPREVVEEVKTTIIEAKADEITDTIGEITEELEEIPHVAPKVTYNGITEGDILTDTEFSHYCACSSCCGVKSVFVTKGGLAVHNGMQNPYILACNWLPIGSVVEIDSQRYTIMDTGGADRLYVVGGFDVFTPEGHSAALEKGIIRDKEVLIVSIAQ